MALINCPECGKEISDRAEKCINCGFPLTPVATINDQSFEISWLKSNEISQIEKIKIIREKTHIRLKEAIDFINEYKPDDTVNKQQIQRQETLKPHCPTCGSTDIQKISGTKRWFSTGLFGLASSDIGKSMCCKKCGYKW